MKTCNTCFLSLPLDSFYRTRRAKDGHDWMCIACAKSIKRASAEKRRLHGPSPTGTRHDGTPRKRVESPMQSSARHAVRAAIQRGALQPQPCEVCGAADVQAHHDDYSRPLRVRWLCDFHHRQHHTNAARQARAARTRASAQI